LRGAGFLLLAVTFKEHNMARRQLYAFFFLCWLFVTFSAPVRAQSDLAAKVAPQPMEVTSTVLHYSSVFDQYQSYDDVQSGSWKDANEAVGSSDVRVYPAEGLNQINSAAGMERHDMSIQSTSEDPSPEQKSRKGVAGLNHPGVKP
jgi:hypothetical protein